MDNIINDLREVRQSRTEFRLVRNIEPIESWVYSEYFIGPDASSIYEFWRQHLIEVFRSDRKPEEYIDQILIDGSIGGGKCVDKDTLISTDRGLLTIQDIYYRFNNGERFKVMSEDGPRDIESVWNEGQKGARIILIDNKEVKTSTIHRFRVLRNGVLQWIQASDLVKGDYIAFRNTEQLFGQNDYNKDYMYVLGVLIGDGDTSGDSYISISARQDDWLIYEPYFKKCFDRIKCEDYQGKTCINSQAWTNICHAKYDFKSIMSKKAGDKEVPDFVFESNKDSIIPFIRGIFDTDGYVDKRGRISLSSKSKKLIYQIYSLLSLFNINMRIEESYNEKYDSIYYNLITRDIDSSIKFGKCIGLNILRKYERIPTQRISKWTNQISIMKNISQEALIEIERNDLKFKKVDGFRNVPGCHTHCYDLTVEGNHTYLIDRLVTHNTTFANLCMMRKLYELSCYENMQALFNLMLSSKIAFTYFNITKDQAEETGFGQLREMIDSSPYFQENFRRNQKTDSVIEWPSEKLSVGFGSGTSSMIGGNLLGSILDEANFYQGDGKEAVAGQVQSKAAKMYTSIRNRGRSRFLKNGINHALNIVVSSSMYANSFMSKLKEECKNDPHTYYIETTIWDVKPKGTYSDERFYVFKGADNLDPALCDTVMDVSNITEVLGYGRLDNFETPAQAIKSLPEEAQSLYFVAIPTDFRKSFDDNLIQALQDIAGVAVAPVGRLFSSRYHYNIALDKSIENPLVAPEVTLSTKSDVTWKDLFKPSFKFEDIGKPRFLHFDQSYAGDKAGISCCHIDKVIETEEGVIPYIKFDFMFTIVPPKPPAQTAIYKLRELIPFLQNTYGITYGKITYDMFASIESMQILQSQGFPVEYQSVDRTDDAYLAFCNLLYEERVKFGYSREFEDNIFNLIHYRSKKKVDHNSEHGKDTSDSAVGAAYNALSSNSVEQSLRSNDVDCWIESMQ